MVENIEHNLTKIEILSRKTHNWEMNRIGMYSSVYMSSLVALTNKRN